MAPEGRPLAVADFTLARGEIVKVALLVDRARMCEPDLTVLSQLTF